MQCLCNNGKWAHIYDPLFSLQLKKSHETNISIQSDPLAKAEISWMNSSLCSWPNHPATFPVQICCLWSYLGSMFSPGRGRCPLRRRSLSVLSQRCSAPQRARAPDPRSPTHEPWRGSWGRRQGILGHQSQATWCSESGRSPWTPLSGTRKELMLISISLYQVNSWLRHLPWSAVAK